MDVFFRNMLGYADQGAEFVFRITGQKDDPALPPYYSLLHTFAFRVLPTIIFFSSFMSVLYYFGVMQWVVRVMAVAMQRTLGTSGAESLSTAANVFVGQTEAPLVIKPYIATLTRSELNAVMVGGFATISGGVLAAFVGMGIDAGHLITASVISAPATLLIAKIMEPETERSVTLGHVTVPIERVGVNAVEAAALGAADGMKLAINVAAMLIAFLALLAMVNGLLGWIGMQFGYTTSKGLPVWKLETALGYLFAPLAWAMGIEWKDCLPAGQLLGLKMAANEFIAYDELGKWMKPGSAVQISARSQQLLTYALCGFANFGSIGIQIGGIGGMAPQRTSDLAQLGLRAMLGGTLATCMTACVAGVLL
jgi:CNT family concentrative nucleoside transporter